MKAINWNPAALLGCVLSVFVFAAKSSACGCDAAGGLTDAGQYELDLGKLTAEPAAVRKTDSGPASAAKTDQAAALKHETVGSTGNVQLNKGGLAVGESVTCTAAAESRGCAVGDYVAASDADAGVMVTTQDKCAAGPEML